MVVRITTIYYISIFTQVNIRNQTFLYITVGEYNSKNKFTKWQLAAVLYKLRQRNKQN